MNIRRTLTRLGALALGLAAATGSEPLSSDRFTGAVLPLLAAACLLYLLVSFAGRAAGGTATGDDGGGSFDFFDHDGDGDGGD